MLARQPEPDDSVEVRANHLKLVGDRLPVQAEPQRRGRFAFVGNAVDRLREQISLDPERYAQLADRLILLGIALVVAVSAYVIFFADPN